MSRPLPDRMVNTGKHHCDNTRALRVKHRSINNGTSS
jgi:hypothetical protein